MTSILQLLRRPPPREDTDDDSQRRLHNGLHRILHPQGFHHTEEQFKVGWEWEVMLTPRHPAQRGSSLSEFAQKLTTVHNDFVTRHAQNRTIMDNRVGRGHAPNSYQHWSAEPDGSLKHHQPTWGIEIVSPVLVAGPNSKWRDHVKATFNAINAYYSISRDEHCSSHVHVSFGDEFRLDGLIRIAQAILHFETAFEVLMPADRKGDIFYGRSNWLNNPNFYLHGVGRKQAIEKVGKCHTKVDVAYTMSPHCRYFGWNFSNSAFGNATIEFRRGQSAKERGGALKWLEVAASFLYAAYHAPNLQCITSFPANKGGLERFIQAANLPQSEGLFQPTHLRGFFKQVHANARQEPGILRDAPNVYMARYLPSSTTRQQKIMEQMIREDEQYGRDGGPS